MASGSPGILLAAAIVGASHAALGQSPVASFVDSTMTLAQRRDTAGLRRIADPQFTFVHSTGRVQNLAEFLAFVVQGGADSIRVLSPPEVHDDGNVAYVVTHTATLAPARGWTAFRATDVVVRTATGFRWLGHQSTALPTTPTFIALASDIAAAVSGRYVSADGVVREVSASGDRLLVRVGYAAPVRYGALTPTTFHADGGDAFIVFLRDESGRIRYLEFLQGTRAERFVRP